MAKDTSPSPAPYSDPGARPEPESLDELRGDGARMDARWRGPAPAARTATAPRPLHGVRVPAGSSRLLEGMSDYGD
ncbi:hypothetical protein JJV70_05780 [Streptomyces sp. JJ66]|uniref:hypothetical protein n=1 Tax=Streptomyces sp. JJ66 TaxID=2803843 RepID=UPI001C5741F7|nr:hypothetical protein [Streptomyces sp. JJ66]MBW1601626.1 hypothetical protein [Streptomyces sp. JJ66]